VLQFHRIDHSFVLRFLDNGVGMPVDMDFRNTESLGLQLVTTLTTQIGGEIEHVSVPGTAFQISFAAPRRAGMKEF
jgi:two-component sensor histidine kinase